MKIIYNTVSIGMRYKFFKIVINPPFQLELLSYKIFHNLLYKNNTLLDIFPDNNFKNSSFNTQEVRSSYFYHRQKQINIILKNKSNEKFSTYKFF